MNAVRLAITWLTVLPLRGPDAVDRTLGGRAISLAPFVGILLGALAAVLWCALCAAGASGLVVGFAEVGFLALATRGMHLDGLADTFDGLGTYGSPERAREVMKSGPVGPFGVAAIVIAVGTQAAAFGDVELFGLALAIIAGRVAVVLACVRGLSPVPQAGLGSFVASTQPAWIAGMWLVLFGAASFVLSPFGPIVVLVVAVMAIGFARHCVRRLGSVNGDVLGAMNELAVAIAAVGFSVL